MDPVFGDATNFQPLEMAGGGAPAAAARSSPEARTFEPLWALGGEGGPPRHASNIDASPQRG